jgi:hypothetical protein
MNGSVFLCVPHKLIYICKKKLNPWLLMESRQTIIMLLFLSCILAGQKVVKGQTYIEFSGKGSFQSILHNRELTPMWQSALTEGRWDNLSGNQVLATASLEANWKLSDDFSFSGTLEADHSSGYEETYLHTGFLKLAWKGITLKAGKHSFAPIFTKQNSGSGSYIFGVNHRPFSRITLEIPNYVPVPFTKQRIEVRGGISQGWLKDQPYSGDVLLHEKYAYMRWNGGKWKPYAGLNHSTLFGGQYSNGEDIPIDFWATFFAKGSEKIGGGEETNAAGAHMGLYDFGIYLDSPCGSWHFYYQIPFSDGSGMLFWQKNTDHILGIDWAPKKNSWLENFTFEWIQTTFQSGNGMPDPYIPDMPEGYKDGIIFPKEVENRNQFVYDVFGIEVEEPLSLEEFKNILEDEINHGNEFGGRDGYMNNGLYPAGWVRENHIMGSPLNLISSQLLAVHPGMEFYSNVGIKNDRYKAIHFGGKGALSKKLKWAAKFTYSRNFGTYFEQYPGRYTWEEVENYWFKDGRDQWYTMIGIGWIPGFAEGITIRCNAAWDAGEIYHSSGIKMTVSYQFY